MEIEKRIVKYDDGSYTEYYHKKGDNNFLHREGGPAVIRYHKNGYIIHKCYWVNGKRHRKDGPAWIDFALDGSIDYESYWINDVYITKEEWEEQYGWKLKLKGTPMGEIFCK